MAYDRIELSDAELSEIEREQYDALYFGTLIQREEISKRAVQALADRNCFRTIFCDVNLRTHCYDRESVELCLQSATILKVSIEEEPLLRELMGYLPNENTIRGIAVALCEAYPQLQIVILTLGKDGSYAYSRKDESECFQCAIGDRVVSTVGAGDSFSAAWLTAYLSGEPMARRQGAVFYNFP